MLCSSLFLPVPHYIQCISMGQRYSDGGGLEPAAKSQTAQKCLDGFERGLLCGLLQELTNPMAVPPGLQVVTISPCSDVGVPIDELL